jgi:hypothetical protein
MTIHMQGKTKFPKKKENKIKNEFIKKKYHTVDIRKQRH